MPANQTHTQSSSTLPRVASSALLQHSLLEPEILAHPNAYYQALRREDPVRFDEKMGMYVVSRYDDLWTIAQDSITFSVGHAWMKTFATGRFEEFKEILIRDGGGYFPDAIMTDPPTHTRVRRLMQAAFSPRRIKALEPAIRRIAADLLDKIAARGSADGVHDFAKPMTIGIMCEQLGLGKVDPVKIETWATAFGNVRMNRSYEDFLVDVKNFCDLQHFIIARVRERQAQRRDDMISDLIYAREEGGDDPSLSFEEVVALTRAMVIGGLDSIGTALSNLLFLVATNPRIAKNFEDSAPDETKLRHFIEETLRIEPPARGLFRCTTRDVDLGGVHVPAGSMMCLLYGSACDDESVFEHPRDFDMDRKNLSRHLAFGAGMHLCVGMHLARMEVKVAAQEIAKRLKDIKLAVPREEIRYAPSVAMLSLESLPLLFSRRH